MKLDLQQLLELPGDDKPKLVRTVQEVPSKWPAQWNGVFVVGDCPYDAEATLPFSNSHYASLAAMLRVAGLDIKQCALGNLLPFHPENGSIKSVPEEQLKLHVGKLFEELKTAKPRVIIVLGRDTFPWFKPGSVDDERGFPFLWNGCPAIGAFHPKEIFVQYKYNLPTISDFTKASDLAANGFHPPSFDNRYKPSFTELVTTLESFIRNKPTLAFDIETASDSQDCPRITCIGFAWTASSAIVVPFREAGRHVWQEWQEAHLWRLVAVVCETCPLVGHYAAHYEHTVMTIYHGIRPNVVGDTMFAQWELQPELEKSLAFCASIYTKIPYWKADLKAARSGKIPAWKEFEYNGMDNIITFQSAREIKEAIKEYPPACYEHYKFNILVSRVFQYMTIRGARLDEVKWSARLKELGEQDEQYEKDFLSAAGKIINVNSPKQMKSWLYEDLKLPVQYKSKRNENGDYEETESQDYLSLLYLARSFPHITALGLAAKLRKHRKRLSSLRGYSTRPADGRGYFCRNTKGYLSWGFNTVGTETGRISGYKPVDGYGIQPQNVDSRDKDLLIADEGCFWLKADLEGADGWTVGVCCAKLGDSTMLNDMLAGLKPAQALAIAQLFGHHLITQPASELLKYKKQFKEVLAQQELQRGPKRTDYDVWKAVSHGSNYGMKKRTMHENIFKKSAGDLFIPEDECERFQKLYYKRYFGLPKWHEHMMGMVSSVGYIDSFAGTRRHFLGRKDNATLRAALSQAPQAHTSYATNVLLCRLFYDQVNRQADGLSLVIQPVNQVHDETDLMFRQDQLDLARSIFHPLTKLEMTYWGIKFEIPFEVGYGENWKECENEF